MGPLRFMNSEGFQEIVGPIATAMEITINSQNTKTNVKLVASEIKAIITAELKHRLFSLKIDSASRHGRSILGVNAQFFANDRIEIRTLGMIELTQRHTAQYIKAEIESILTIFECSIQQVCSCTTDNGANMLKCVALLENTQEEELEVVPEDDHTEEEVIRSLDDSVSYSTLRCVRCASHTLQLAVSDVLKQHGTNIQAIRQVIKTVRSAQLKRLDVPTRWNSTFFMLKSINDNKMFYQSLQEGSLVNENLWLFVEEFVNTFEPVFYCTKRLQEEQLTIGDFIYSWIELKMKLSHINNELAKEMMSSMINRQLKLVENDIVKAALYLHQRFNFAGSSSVYLSTESKIEAEEYLMKIYQAIQTLSPHVDITFAAATTQLDADPSNTNSSYYCCNGLQNLQCDA